MERDLSLLKKDLSIILHLNAKIKYHDKNQVQNVHNDILQQQLFKTDLGQKFVTRLEYILMDAPNAKCLLCETENELNGIICTNCIDKYQNKPTSAKKAVSEPPATPESPSKIEPPVTKTPEPPVIKEPEPEIAVEIEDLILPEKPARKKRKRRRSFKPNPRGFILLAAVLAVIILLLILGGIKTLLAGIAVVTTAFSVFSFLKIRQKIWIPIVSSVISVILIGTSIVLFMPKSIEEENLINYLGTLEADAYIDYDESKFYEVNNFKTNENYVESGCPAIAIYHGEVDTIVLSATTDSSYSIANIHIGDTEEQVKEAVSINRLHYVANKSTTSTQMEYTTQYKGQDVQIIVNYRNGRVTRVSCGWARNY